MIIVDSSVWFDLFNTDKYRRNLAKKLFELIESKDIPILEPRVFEIEFIALLSRKYIKEEVINIFNTVKDKIVVLPNPDDLAFNIALNTGCRAIDSYFIALTKLTDSLLVSNDKTQISNARKFKVKSYYLIEEFDKFKEEL
ncbi:MAG TPA: PIN domain-containing protein [Candidatus Omnitrophica bacterium]|nr:PIN domain-containing protein [Candidatus Omnitrophota bacterium]